MRKSSDETIYILGKCFKPETNITLGSPSILLANILIELGERVVLWDPYDGDYNLFLNINGLNKRRGLFFIGTQHEAFKDYQFPKGSTLIDPFRYLKVDNDIKYIPIEKIQIKIYF